MRFYRILLRLYPSSFRAEYGEEMAAMFARRLRAESGFPGILLLQARTIFDVLPNALHAHSDILRQDLRYTARTLARFPGFAATAICVTALGIGATTATFSITDHVLIRPLPFADAGRLVKLWQTDSAQSYRNQMTAANYRDWKQLSSSFEAMAVLSRTSVNLVGEGDPRRLNGAAVTASLLPMLGRQPVLGRVFSEAEDQEGAAGTLLLSHRLWREQFGADPNVLGRKVILDDAPYEVIGVMPADFNFPSRETLLWTAARIDKAHTEDLGDNYLEGVGKLKRGVTLAQARAEMSLVTAQLERAGPKENFQVRAMIISMRDEIVPRSRMLLKVLLLAALGVLLIACTNLASLLLTRALARRRELAVRKAMGAGRDRLVRQLLTESLVLAFCGGALGVGLAILAIPLILRLVPNTLPIAAAPHVDLRMVFFAAILTIGTGIAFGVAPALKACRESDTDALGEGSRTGSSRRTEKLRSVLVVAEVTASVALLIGSGLLIRALWRLQGTDPGFRSEGVLTLRTAPPLPKYEKTEKRAQLYQAILSDVRRLPGVSSAAYISGLPMAMRAGIWPIVPEGKPDDPGRNKSASMRYVTPGFFAALGIPMRTGRDLADTDTFTAPYVAVVSESLARQNWPGENPIGKRFQVAFDMRTVIGVVGDIRVRGVEQASEPQVYLSYQQVKDGNIIGYVPKDLVVRSAVPGTLLPSIRRIVAAADPQLPISDVQMLADIVDAETAPRAVQVRVLGAFAAAALLLAGIGIHGLLAFAVSQRTREIGVRMALGAQTSEILAMVLRQGLLLAGAGVALGAAVAWAGSRAMQALLAGISPADPPVFAVAIGISLLMTAVGSAVPAIRAVRVNPMTAIRSE
jgi:putative ABC transport system permease protein